MMIAIRSGIYFIFMVLTVVLFGLTMATIGRLMPLSVRDSIANAWGMSNLWLLKLICGLDYRIEGAENLPEHSAIIMSKHQSTWETMSLRGLVAKNQSWILKQELMRVPIFGWALSAVPTIAIDRKAGRKAIKQVVEQGSKLLDQGRIIMIFPEGTRTFPGKSGKYGLGGALLAEKSEYPVIPIAHNAGVFWRRRGLEKHPGTIDVVIGEPISTKGRKASQIIREVEEWIESRVAEMPQSPSP